MSEPLLPDGATRAELHASAQLEALWDAAVGIGFLDEKLRFTRVNRALSEMSGLPPEAHFGRPLPEVLPQMDPELQEALEEVLASGQARLNFVVQGVTPARPSELRQWSISLFPVRARAKVLGLGMTATDVTERVRADTEGRLLREVLRQIPVGVLVQDAKTHRYILESEGLQRIFGGPVEEHLRQPPHVRPDGTSPDPVDAPLRSAGSGGLVTEGRVLDFRHPGGAVRLLRVSAAPLRNADGEVVAAVGTYQDVTEEVRAHNLEQQLMGIVGHDLRNPLATISLALDVLVARGGLQGALRQSVERASRSVVRIQNIVRDLLDSTSVRHTGQLAVHPVPMSWAERARQQVEDLRATQDGRTLHFTTSGDCAGFWDGDRLDQVVANLVGNAIQHSPPESDVHVVLGELPGDWVQLSIHNPGPPIPAELLPVLFDPFTHGAAKDGGKSRSIGMGLYIARAIIEAHHGTLEVRTSEADGTTFTVKLPRDARAPEVSRA